jgi:photosystem II stability/assembly factor-like uncharacterized protein
MKRLKQILAAAAVCLMLTACSSGKPTPAPAPGPGQVPPPAAGAITLTADPATGAAGTPIILTLKVPDAARITARQPDGTFTAHVCFSNCGRGGFRTGVLFKPGSGDAGTFTGAFTVPASLPIGATDGLVPTPVGSYPILVACVLDGSKGCAEHTEGEATFAVNKTAAEVIPWTSLNLTGTTPLARLGAYGQTSVWQDRKVACRGGVAPGSTEVGEPAALEVTQGSSTYVVPLSSAPITGQHGLVGCQAVALDPKAPASFYLVESGNNGSAEGRFPKPLVTRNQGQSWSVVPTPDGFEAGLDFAGFSVGDAGVTAWYSKARPKQAFTAGSIQGSYTPDGGKTWQMVNPTCPPEHGCILQVRVPREMVPRDGLLASKDGGKSWQWVTMTDKPLTAPRFYRASDGALIAVTATIGQPDALDNTFAPLLRSPDGGATWSWVQLPEPPGGLTANRYPFLQVQDDGSLLLSVLSAQGEQQWLKLPEGGQQWAPASAPADRGE